MTTNNHPITPPLELVEQWADASARTHRENRTHIDHEFAIATQAARWGANTELEACVKWVSEYYPYFGGYPLPEDELRATRRPKPPSLKEQALAALARLKSGALCADRVTDESTIRRALEALPE